MKGWAVLFALALCGLSTGCGSTSWEGSYKGKATGTLEYKKSETGGTATEIKEVENFPVVVMKKGDQIEVTVADDKLIKKCQFSAGVSGNKGSIGWGTTCSVSFNNYTGDVKFGGDVWKDSGGEFHLVLRGKPEGDAQAESFTLEFTGQS
jgi:hypothetical protein